MALSAVLDGSKKRIQTHEIFTQRKLLGTLSIVNILISSFGQEMFNCRFCILFTACHFEKPLYLFSERILILIRKEGIPLFIGSSFCHFCVQRTEKKRQREIIAKCSRLGVSLNLDANVYSKM